MNFIASGSGYKIQLANQPGLYLTATTSGTDAIWAASSTSNYQLWSPAVTVVDVNTFIQETVWNYFIGKGFSKKQVAGIMGNVMQESGWNPLSRSSGSSYWGLVQLNSTLSSQLNTAYSNAGLNMSDYGYTVSKYQGAGAQNNIPINDLTIILSVQLNFIYGCTPTGGNWKTPLGASASIEESAEIFLTVFEGAVSTNPVAANKIIYYTPYLNKYYQGAEQRRNSAVVYYNKFA